MADQAAARLRYSNVAIFLHWAMAVLILYNLFTGFLHDALQVVVLQIDAFPDERRQMFGPHAED